MPRKTGRNDDRAARHIESEEACRRLGVKRATLYTYVSRGLIRTVPTGGRRRLYVAADVDRIAARSAARRGHAAVAAGALRWGDPVLDSGISEVGAAGFRYRGQDVATLVEEQRSFEEVAELLWDGDVEADWPNPAKALPALRGEVPPVWSLVSLLPVLALADGDRYGSVDDLERNRARRLLRAFATRLAGERKAPPGRIAEILAGAFRGSRGDTALVDMLLVLTADHELNVSTFAARVAASAGAGLYASVGAALYAFTGPQHGASCDRIEALVEEARRRRKPGLVISERLARGESLPGFGHRLYPDGDPRCPPVLEALPSKAKRQGPVRTLLALVEAAEDQVGLKPTVDLAAVAVAGALGAPAGFATALFAVGRTAGWVAHAIEQRRSGETLRPRARYVGPAPE
jgi:citrate synthase